MVMQLVHAVDSGGRIMVFGSAGGMHAGIVAKQALLNTVH